MRVLEILRAPVKQFFRFLKGRNCKCGHGLSSHSETRKCTSHIGFVRACPFSSYEQYPKQTWLENTFSQNYHLYLHLLIMKKFIKLE
jgi:hypothetical protein